MKINSHAIKKIALLSTIGFIFIIFIIIWVLYVQNKPENVNSLTKETPTSNTAADSGVDADVSSVDDNPYYNLPSQKIRVKLTSDTMSLTAIGADNGYWFTLNDFLDRANEAGYSRIAKDGTNACQRIGHITIYDNAMAIRDAADEVTGPLVDDSGSPSNGRRDVINLKDGRYVYISTLQASCKSNSSFDGSDLEKYENSTINAIKSLLQSSIESY